MPPSNRPRRQKSRPAWQVFVVMVAALLLAAVISGESLREGADKQPFGTERDFWLTVWDPFSRVSHALMLDEPRDWAEERFGHASDDAIFELPTPDPTPVPATAVPTASPTATPVPTPPLRTPGPGDPLRLWVGGDSMAEVVGQSLLRMAKDRGHFVGELDCRVSSGLSRPDYYDWPGEIASLARSGEGPEVLVLMFGANDAQGLITPDGDVYQPGDEGWKREYARRVAATMDLAAAPGRFVVWVGQPVMRSGKLNSHMVEVNTIYRKAAAARPRVRYVDLYSLFVDGAGQYSAYLPDAGGDMQLMRQPDGVHFTRAGGDRAADAVLDAIEEAMEVPR